MIFQFHFIIITFLFLFQCSLTIEAEQTYQLKWKFSATVSICSTVVITPDNNLYDIEKSYQYLYFMTRTGYVIALNRKSGSLLWSQETYGSVDGKPKSSNPSLVHYDVPIKINTTDSIKSNLMDKGVLIAKASNISRWAVIVGGVQAFDGATGTPLWSTPFISTRDHHPIVSKVNNTQILYIGSRVSSIFALDAIYGNLLWRTTIDGGSTTSPVVLNNKEAEASVIFIGALI